MKASSVSMWKTCVRCRRPATQSGISRPSKMAFRRAPTVVRQYSAASDVVNQGEVKLLRVIGPSA
jgi:hypothetical protein